VRFCGESSDQEFTRRQPFDSIRPVILTRCRRLGQEYGAILGPMGHDNLNVWHAAAVRENDAPRECRGRAQHDVEVRVRARPEIDLRPGVEAWRELEAPGTDSPAGVPPAIRRESITSLLEVREGECSLVVRGRGPRLHPESLAVDSAEHHRCEDDEPRVRGHDVTGNASSLDPGRRVHLRRRCDHEAEESGQDNKR
jgi:hypothetical protein